jgi:class 3 adenylate cyclase/tetratricopeptide (TPR) repeat protein
MTSRQCVDCGFRASERARFCEQCGAALTPSAAPLRAPIALEARILEERAGIQGERKQVTVMYADIAGSMALTHALDAERWGLVLDRFLAIAAGAVHEFEGTVNQFTGDGLLAVFGAPLAHEDHARRACLAVLELQRQTAVLAADVAQRDGLTFAVRCGLNSGEVVVGAIGEDVHMDFVPIGNTTALGKRIESLAPAGSIAISASTAALVEGEFVLRELGEFEVKGAEGRHRVLELIGPGPARSRFAALVATRGLSRFVGREAERAELEVALEQALAGNGRAVGIVGEPGVGKSRLVHEFVADCAARGVTVNATAGVAHGRYLPFLPMLALYRDYFGIDERDAPRIARKRIEATMLALDRSFAEDLPVLFDFLGVSDPMRPLGPLDRVDRHGRLLDLARRSVEARSGREPAVLVVEDLHWLDDGSIALFENLVAAAIGTRTVVVSTYRPEYEAAWTRNEPHIQLDLGPLDEDATDDLLGELLGRHRPPAGLTDLIKARTAGNPFFIEEIVQTLVEDGQLADVLERQLAAGSGGIALPPTVQAGLAARIDRLPDREKALVQTMSVIGAEIPAELLSAVSMLDETELARAVQTLADARMVIAHSSNGSEEYVFKHPLTQEVAYGSQLSETRARAHRTVAAAIERMYPDGLDERAALLAHHREAAGDELTGARWHARAGAWAEITAPAVGMAHWRRVRHLASRLEASPERDDLAAKARIGVLSLAWRLGVSPEETAAIRAETHADPEQFLADLFYAGSLMHGGREREGLDGFRAASHAAVAAGNAGRVLTASAGVAYASWIAGALSEAMETIDLALVLADDDPMTGSGLAFVCPLANAYNHRGQCEGYMGELVRARDDFDRAIELAREYDDSETESACHASRSQLEADVGEYGAALRHAALGLEISERSGNVVHIIACTVPAVAAKAGAGRFADALADAESSLATIRKHGIGLYYEPVLLATIARSRLALGDGDAALAAAEEAVAITNARGLATCALSAPITLAQVLIETTDPTTPVDPKRIDALLGRAMGVARQSGAVVFESQIAELQVQA